MTPEVQERIAQIRRGEVPDGYKRGKLGVMPTEWEIVSFRQMFRPLNRRNASGNANVLTISAQQGLVSQNAFFKKNIASQNTENYFLLKRGDFAYNKSYSKGYPFGALKPLTLYESGIVSPLYICFSPSEENPSPEYYAQYFDAGLMNGEIQAFAQEGARNHGLLNISIRDFFNSSLIFPTPEEQRRIAEILSAQDNVIKLKERLLTEKWRQKKWLMQRLLTGKQRLPGFTGEWVTGLLGNLFSERVETNHESLELLAITGSQGVIPRHYLELKDNSSEDKSKYLKIHVGDIGYNTMRMWQGVSAYSNYEGIVSPAYTILKPCKDIDARYFAYLFKMKHMIFLFYRFSQGLVDDTRNLKYTNFRKISALYPADRAEQTAIADILSVADREIDLLRASLEQEKRKKKALSQLLLTGIVRCISNE